MSDDRNPNLGDLDKVSVEPDRKSGPARGAAPAASGNGRKAAASPAAPAGGQHWMWATLVLGVLVVVLSTWFYKQISVLQAQMDNKLSDSTEQLGNLASQLSATDESLNQSSEQISDTLKLHDSEIRKLWGVSNDRNKQWIRENQDAIAKLVKQQSGVDKSVAALRADLQKLDSSLKQQVIARNQVQTQIDVLAESVKQAESRVAAQKKTLDSLAAIQSQLQSLAALEKGEGLDGRLMEIEAAINAIDAYRKPVNVRLDKLEARSP